MQLALVIAIVGGAWLALRGSVDEPVQPVPTEIGNMKKSSLVTGKQALQQVQEMHRGDIRIGDGYIAGYQNGGERMTLWVGIAGNDAEASKVLEDMAAAIGKGGTPFSTPVQMTLAGTKTFFASGAGGSNYFFRSGRSVVWILLTNSAAPEKRVGEVLNTVKFE